MSLTKETYITPKNNVLSLNFSEIWQYRDLLLLFVKRDIVTLYKQTILGPLWYLIQPLFTSIIFTIMFNRIAGISTGGVNSFLYNLAGIMIWNYFADCINGTSDTFKKNESIFGKVYFPRVIIPLSVIVSNLVKFAIQLGIFICFYIFFYFKNQSGSLGWEIVFLPFFVACMGFIGLGFGMIISALTTKYRDLIFLVQFSVTLLMYLSAVMYPLSLAKQKLPHVLQSFVQYNPLALLIDNLRNILFEAGSNFTIIDIAYPFFASIVIVFIGFILFNKTEKSFIDTI